MGQKDTQVVRKIESIKRDPGVREQNEVLLYILGQGRGVRDVRLGLDCESECYSFP